MEWFWLLLSRYNKEKKKMPRISNDTELDMKKVKLGATPFIQLSQFTAQATTNGAITP